MRGQSVFYHTLKVGEIGQQGVKIRIFSDVGATRLAIDPLTCAGDFPESSCSCRCVPSCCRMEHNPVVPARNDALVFEKQLHTICSQPERISRSERHLGYLGG